MKRDEKQYLEHETTWDEMYTNTGADMKVIWRWCLEGDVEWYEGDV